MPCVCLKRGGGEFGRGVTCQRGRRRSKELSGHGCNSRGGKNVNVCTRLSSDQTAESVQRGRNSPESPFFWYAGEGGGQRAPSSARENGLCTGICGASDLAADLVELLLPNDGAEGDDGGSEGADSRHLAHLQTSNTSPGPALLSAADHNISTGLRDPGESAGLGGHSKPSAAGEGGRSREGGG
jgi:hypothetical protein